MRRVGARRAGRAALPVVGGEARPHPQPARYRRGPGAVCCVRVRRPQPGAGRRRGRHHQFLCRVAEYRQPPVPGGRRRPGVAGTPGLGELAALARSSHHSGAGLSNGCSRIAARLRDDGADHATAEAERAGVLIALPMTLCYLPAFFLLGLAPMVISLGTSILSSH